MKFDPIIDIQKIVKSFLETNLPSEEVEIESSIQRKVRWRPHILERRALRGWEIHIQDPESDTWSLRITRARNALPTLNVGVIAPEHLFSNELFLAECFNLNSSLLVLKQSRGAFVVDKRYGSVADLIYENRLKLSHGCVTALLDIALERAISEPNAQRKGVLLELLVAMLLSQVDGFEVKSVGISNRSQQMDVLVHNRNVGGALGGSPIVLAEAKNWKDPVGPNEYASFLRKLKSRHGRAKLGYLITTGKFTSGVADERRRESQGDILVVLIDGTLLPTLWRGPESITAKFEDQSVIDAIGT